MLEQKKEQQRKISLRLKALVVALAALGVALWGALANYVFFAETADALVMIGDRIFFFFSLGVALMCCVILLLFWGVCTQIGRDNSFSKENAAAFRRMAFCGVGIALISLLCLAVSGVAPGGLLRIPVSVAACAFGVVFYILCSALSGLIFGAYEIKAENDLTI